MLTLRNERAELVLAPAVGGGIAVFRFDGVDVMRAATRQAIDARDPLGLACFPLVPYSNRIRDGRFTFEGRAVQLRLNYGAHPHSIHGQGWQNPWVVEAADGTRARLGYLHEVHEVHAWPWVYKAVQQFRLLDDGLEVALSVENRSDSRMPAGLGLHPYYPRTSGTRLDARLDGWWETDDTQMPVRFCPTEPRTQWTEWLHRDTTTDNVFSGWDGTARLTWPESGLRMTMHASDAACHLVVYAPVEQPITVVEPVTHPTDALNDPALPGIHILEPGETFSLTVRLAVERG